MVEQAGETGTGAERQLLGMIVVLCGLLVAGGITVPILLGATAPPSPLTLGDVSGAQLVEIREPGGATVVSGEFRSRIDALGNVEKDAALADRGGHRIIGEVEIEIPAPGRANRRTELEVDVMGLPALKTFLVVIDDRVVSAFRTDDRGSFDMEVQEGEVPTPATAF